MTDAPVRLLILGAHPDDAEYHAGGLAARQARRGAVVKLVSVTDGGAGHHWLDPATLRQTRRSEAAAAGAVLGAPYEVWDFPDGALLPTLEVRLAIIREMRRFRPDLVLTHRTNDYHPDHRAVGQAVQDAAYLVRVPLVAPDVPPLPRDPVTACMVDLFTRPAPLRADVVLDVSGELDTILAMLACHASQVFDWLPHVEGLPKPPEPPDERRAWLREWFLSHAGPRAERFREALVAAYGPFRGPAVKLCEAYEISEYAGKLGEEQRGRLFPRE